MQPIGFRCGLRRDLILNGIFPLDIAFGEQVITPVVLQDDRDTILIDCGYPQFIPQLESAAARHGLRLDAITKIIATHHDIDHIGSLAALKRAYPILEIIAHHLETPYIGGDRKSLRLVQAETGYDALSESEKEHADAFMAFIRSVEPVKVDRTVTHADKLPWCGGIEIVHTPGHLPGHISLYLPASKTMIAADAVVVEEERLNLANPQYALDLKEAVRSVRRLLDYDIRQLICYHGGVFQGEIREALRQLIEDYSFVEADSGESLKEQLPDGEEE